MNRGTQWMAQRREGAAPVNLRALRGRARPGARPHRAHTDAQPGLSTRDFIHSESRMSGRLRPHVLNRPPQVTDAERAEVVAVGPPQPGAWHHAVAVGDARTRTLQALNESRDVGAGRELENHVHVVPHYPEIDYTSSVTARDFGKHPTQERRRAGVDEWQSAQRGPREERVETNRHEESIRRAPRRSRTILAQPGSFERALTGRPLAPSPALSPGPTKGEFG